VADEQTTSVETADVLAIDDAIARSSGAGSFGVTEHGFVPKSFARLLAEKLALARALLGDDLDLGSGSAIRKLLEVSALEDMRTWAALASIYDNSFVSSATGEALSRLGDELGVERPFLEARGSVKLKLTGSPPESDPEVVIPRGARLLTPGGHHVAVDERVVLSAASTERVVAVVAFHPGPEHNLDPGVPEQKLDRLNPIDDQLRPLFELREGSGNAFDVEVEHNKPLTGGALQWPDARYRELLLRAPRSVWRADAIEIAASLVPGVRQVQVRDGWGGLDIGQSIFGNFNFVERLFGSERDLGSPYYLDVLVAPTPAAIWDGPDGLRAAVESAIEDLRPISIFPRVEQAEQLGIGIAADLVVRGLPLPSGSRATVNASPPAAALKERLLRRVRQYVDGLGFGEPVRAAEVIWVLMNEPGVADVRRPRLLRYPAGLDAVDFATTPVPSTVEEFECGANVELQANQVPVLVEDDSGLTIV
jgi:Baseplate J-like protein